jgi:hypothetical protein
MSPTKPTARVNWLQAKTAAWPRTKLVARPRAIYSASPSDETEEKETIMSFTLVRNYKSFEWSYREWAGLLVFAGAYDWLPSETRSPLDWEPLNKWKDAFYFCDGHVVSQQDSRNFARALKKALPKIPGAEYKVSESEALDGFEVLTYLFVRNDLYVRLFDAECALSAVPRKRITDFIQFCQRGGFTIYSTCTIGEARGDYSRGPRISEWRTMSSEKRRQA